MLDWIGISLGMLGRSEVEMRNDYARCDEVGLRQ
jgi:hypothetical protein